MKQKLSEIQQIADNPDSPTFENSMVNLGKTGQLLQRAQQVFNLLTGANTNPELQRLKETEAPKLAANDDAIYLNSKLFKRVETLYNQRAQLKLDDEFKRLLEYYYQKFELAGAKLSDADKDELKKLNQQGASMNAQFTNRLLRATKAGALTVSDSAELNGLPSGTKDAAAQKANADKLSGKWVISLQNTTQQPDLQFLSNRAMRQKLLEASWNRAEKKVSNDTRELIMQIAHIRAQRAQLLDFTNYAACKTQDQMAKTPDAVNQFLSKLVPAAKAKARMEAADIKALINKQTRENGQRFRDMILCRGNTEDLATMFLDFRGHDPEIKPMLENRGLKTN